MRIAFVLFFFVNMSFAQSASLEGVWQNNEEGTVSTIIATDSYLSLVKYKTDGDFLETFGGKYILSNTDEIFIDYDYHTTSIDVVNSRQSYNVSLKKKSFEIKGIKYKKLDTQKSVMNGLWQISARQNTNGEMQEMKAGSRKTYKILMDGYFQWIAFDNQSHEFFGSGGGTFTLDKGKYQEKILVFSKDKKRIGDVIIFDADVNNSEWIHFGVNSKGDNIKELWKKK